MWCDNCDQLTCSTNTTYRITKKGKDVRIDHCSDCKATIETEVIKEKTVRIQKTKKRSK